MDTGQSYPRRMYEFYKFEMLLYDCGFPIGSKRLQTYWSNGCQLTYY
ncbi:Uncharacterised protein [Legionella beliardensis]|uniref:Uncharacterized protein n=1 Tax=Legionella beliardensis TaxID=91822 RepID=A0A378ICN3_9GAMM|nr:Uncharacterised protein [Legionella beliardensis]